MGIDIGCIEQVDIRFDANVDEAARLLAVGDTPGAEQWPCPTERAGSET